MRPDAAAAELAPYIAGLLEPLDTGDIGGGPARASDFDLNPELRPLAHRELRPAAVLVPLVDRPEGLSVLLTRRADTLRKHTGQVAFPGGRCDPGETVVETALREAQEEIGLPSEFVTPLGLATSYQTVTAFLVTPVVALVRPGFTLAVNPAEVADVFEVPFPWLMDPANHLEQFREPVGGGPRRRFYAMPYGGQYIWGATAGMIRGLQQRLFGGMAPGQREPAAKDLPTDDSGLPRR